jgi:hypothetical protein
MELIAIVLAYLLGAVGIVAVGLRLERKLTKDRSADYDRQDQVAERLQENAHQLLEEYKRSSDATVSIVRETRATFDVVNDIHTLVNSEKTAAIQRELSATKRELILLKELGRPASVIEATESVIRELEVTLAEREAAQAKVDQAHS